MNIRQASTSYEKWIASCIPLDRHALSFKHKQMSVGLFPFLRATFYRWVQIWREVEERLLYSMGWETANIHFGTPRAIPPIKRDLAKRPGNWLHKAAKAMLRATESDWREWKRS
jgi:hypothetical protein